MDWFIDKLNVQQTHDMDLPIVAATLNQFTDLESGEMKQSHSFKPLEGSFSSNINIRCDGSRVTVQGNPSRWNRSENLFGFQTFDECIAVYNKILTAFGLPPFTKASQFWYLEGKDGSKAKLTSNGALLDAVDWTSNHMVGMSREKSFIRGMSTQTLKPNKVPYLYPNGMTVDWFKGSSSLYKKLYCKHWDLQKHRKERLLNATQDEIEYYDRLIDFCINSGVVREEHSFKQQWLRRKKLQFYGRTTEEDFIPCLGAIRDAMGRCEVSHMDYKQISDQLLEKGVVKSRQSANATEAYANRWLMGEDVRPEGRAGKSQYYTHRTRLLELGIDISQMHDVSRLPPQIRSIEAIDVQPLGVPDWYQMPESPKPSHLRLVA